LNDSAEKFWKQGQTTYCLFDAMNEVTMVCPRFSCLGGSEVQIGHDRQSTPQQLPPRDAPRQSRYNRASEEHPSGSSRSGTRSSPSHRIDLRAPLDAGAVADIHAAMDRYGRAGVPRSAADRRGADRFTNTLGKIEAQHGHNVTRLDQRRLGMR